MKIKREYIVGGIIVVCIILLSLYISSKEGMDTTPLPIVVGSATLPPRPPPVVTMYSLPNYQGLQSAWSHPQTIPYASLVPAGSFHIANGYKVMVSPNKDCSNFTTYYGDEPDVKKNTMCVQITPV